MRGLGALEAVVMERLWSMREPQPVRAVFEDLRRQRPLAYTTVVTVMDNLHRKGWVTRELVGRAYLYRPVRSREEHSAQLMGEALADSADPASTLIHFVERMSPEEARLLRDALAQATSGPDTRERPQEPATRHGREPPPGGAL